jgi:dephospho-CoA kinase
MSHDNGTGVRIGVAGYMGAGKSSAAATLAALTGMRVVDADAEAKLLMESDTRIRDGLSRAFGPKAADSAKVNFAALGAAAFASADDMRKLNAIVHPPLVRRLRELVFSRPGPCILDAALIPLWRIEDWFSSCVWIWAPSETRLARVAARTGMPENAVQQRMLVQESLFAEPSSPLWTTVVNDGSPEELKDRIEKFVSGPGFPGRP